jgi:hypothetical protein
MKFVNLETGKVRKFVKSNEGFKVVYPHGIGVETYTCLRAIQTTIDNLYAVWADYMVFQSRYVMIISLETGEKFVTVRD